MDLKKIIQSSPAFVVPAIINLVCLVVFTRILSLDTYGKLSLALISIEFLQGLFYQWIKLGMMRFYSRESNFSSIHIGMQYNFTVTALLLGIAVIVITSNHFFDLSLQDEFLLIVLGSIGRGYANFILDYIRIDNDNFTQYTWVSLLINICYYIPAIIYLLIENNASVLEILYVQIGGILLFVIGYSIYNNKLLKNLFVINEFNKYKEFFNYGLPLIIVFLASNMFIRIDRFIIEYNIGLKAVGIYSAAFSLSNLAIGSFFTILTLPTYPEIIRKLNEGDNLAAKVLYDRNGNIILLIAVPLVLLSIALNSEVCILLFGTTKGPQVAPIFPYVVTGMFLYNFKVHYFDQIFQFGKKTRQYMILGIVIGTTHLFGAYLLTKIYGTIGVAISSIIIHLSAILFIFYYSRSFFPISLNKTILSIIFLFGTIVALSYVIIHNN